MERVPVLPDGAHQPRLHEGQLLRQGGDDPPAGPGQHAQCEFGDGDSHEQAVINWKDFSRLGLRVWVKRTGEKIFSAARLG